MIIAELDSTNHGWEECDNPACIILNSTGTTAPVAHLSIYARQYKIIGAREHGATLGVAFMRGEVSDCAIYCTFVLFQQAHLS